MGIETVFQDLALANDLSVWANLFLGREVPARGIGRVVGWMDKRTMRARSREVLDRLRIPISDVNTSADDLSGGQRQAVAVARTALWGRKLVIMDEPTASLGVEQQGRVADLVRTLATEKLAVLLVSHNLAQIFELADRIVVLRHGRRVAVRQTKETSREEIVGLITGALEGDAVAQLT
jgi:ABC-type sugar transport system ATPase subunit